MSRKPLLSTRKMVLDAMLAAMCAVLGYLAIDLGSIKVTLESIPIMLGAVLFGPADGCLIGLVGTLVYQLLRYGLSVTTLLWILPYVVCGLLDGLLARRLAFRPSRLQTLLIIVLSELVVTTLNTGVLYLDSKIYGYYYPALIVGMLALRYVVCVVKAVVTGLVFPPLLRMIRKLPFLTQS